MVEYIPFSDTVHLSASASSSYGYIDFSWTAGKSSVPKSTSGSTYIEGTGISPFGVTCAVGQVQSGSYSIWVGYGGSGTWYSDLGTSAQTSVSATASSPPPSYPPSWTDNTLGGFQVSVAYSDGVAATNMSYSGSYSVSSGSLPTSISLNTSTGAVTGTPTVAGAYSFTITATNSYNSVSQAFSGSVAAAPTYPPSWSDSSLAAFVIGQAYSDGVSATNMSYSGAYSVSSGSLPAGISLNTSTGAVTGTPTTNTNYSFTLMATNTYGSVSQSFNGTIGGGVAVTDGSSWYKGPVKVYNGSTWNLATVKIYNGSTWEVTK